jgi:hypothetical protein
MKDNYELRAGAEVRSLLLDAMAAIVDGDELHFEAAVRAARAYDQDVIMRTAALTLENALSSDDEGGVKLTSWLGIMRDHDLTRYRKLLREHEDQQQRERLFFEAAEQAVTGPGGPDEFRHTPEEGGEGKDE